MTSEPDPTPARRSSPPGRPPAGRGGGRRSTVAVVAVAALALGGCGRSAPEGALAEAGTVPTGSSLPDIAGVTITSPDAVVDPLSATTSSLVEDTEPRGVYVVEAGDTLSVIADELGVTMDELAEFNGLADVDDLTPGQELLIPPLTPVEVTVEGGSGGSAPTTTPAVTTPLVTPAQGAGGTNAPGG